MTLAAPPAPSRSSVLSQGLAEAELHKWIESEKAGRDLGEVAIDQWVRRHWNAFLRDRWIEHIEGRRFWIELDRDDFGLLQRAFFDNAIFDPILGHLKAGWENLELLIWAREQTLPMDEVIEILEILDINRRRIEFQIERLRGYN